MLTPEEVRGYSLILKPGGLKIYAVIEKDGNACIRRIPEQFMTDDNFKNDLKQILAGAGVNVEGIISENQPKSGDTLLNQFKKEIMNETEVKKINQKYNEIMLPKIKR